MNEIKSSVGIGQFTYHNDFKERLEKVTFKDGTVALAFVQYIYK